MTLQFLQGCQFAIEKKENVKGLAAKSAWPPVKYI